MRFYEIFMSNKIWVILKGCVAITNNVMFMKLNSVVLKPLYNNIYKKNFATFNRNMFYFVTKIAKNIKNEPN